MNFTKRSDLTTSIHDFEALWIQTIIHGQPNMVCGVIYWLPNGNLDNFMNYINEKVEKNQQEEKLVLLKGDFNIHR